MNKLMHEYSSAIGTKAVKIQGKNPQPRHAGREGDYPTAEQEVVGLLKDPLAWCYVRGQSREETIKPASPQGVVALRPPRPALREVKGECPQSPVRFSQAWGVGGPPLQWSLMSFE